MAKKTETSRYIQFYTAGSAAQKVELVDERQWAPLPEYQIRKKKRIHIDPVAITGILAAIFLMITMMIGVNKLVEQRTEAARMEAYVTQLQEENRSLSKEYAAGYDLSVVENRALNMGMVPKAEANEITIYVPAEAPVEQPQSVAPWDQITTFLAGLFA